MHHMQNTNNDFKNQESHCQMLIINWILYLYKLIEWSCFQNLFTILVSTEIAEESIDHTYRRYLYIIIISIDCVLYVILIVNIID